MSIKLVRNNKKILGLKFFNYYIFKYNKNSYIQSSIVSSTILGQQEKQLAEGLYLVKYKNKLTLWVIPGYYNTYRKKNFIILGKS